MFSGFYYESSGAAKKKHRPDLLRNLESGLAVSDFLPHILKTDISRPDPMMLQRSSLVLFIVVLAQKDTLGHTCFILYQERRGSSCFLTGIGGCDHYLIANVRLWYT
jgi:hypothetical protein